jgi:hypothetical protein
VLTINQHSFDFGPGIGGSFAPDHQSFIVSLNEQITTGFFFNGGEFNIPVAPFTSAPQWGASGRFTDELVIFDGVPVFAPAPIVGTGLPALIAVMLVLGWWRRRQRAA